MNVPELQAWISANYRKFEDIAGWVNSGFFRKAIHRQTSAGSAHAGLPIVLDANGHVDATMLNDADIDHGSIGGLTDDDHTQYALLLGRSGGQSLTGGTAANDDITIQGTSNATRTTSYVLLQPNGGLVGVGVTPEAPLHASGTTDTAIVLVDNNRYYGGESGGGSAIRLLGITASNVVYVGGVDSTAGANTIIRQSGSDIITLATSLVTIANAVTINGALTATSLNVGEDTLSIFDEGTWTPAISGTVTNPTVTYTSRYGRYVRVNSLVHFQAEIVIATFSGGSGNAVFSLPFAAASDGTQSGAAYSSTTGQGSEVGTFVVNASASNGFIYYASAGVVLAIADLAATNTLRYSGSYFI
jgi:hypothetical protein